MKLIVTRNRELEKLEKRLRSASNADFRRVLKRYGEEGVRALAEATPKDSGNTAGAWRYQITGDRGDLSLIWTNDNVNDGVNIAVILQYGHGTGTGGYVQGIDYINPALKPVFEKIASDAWKELTRR
jgi:hypothetical protein